MIEMKTIQADSNMVEPDVPIGLLEMCANLPDEDIGLHP